MRFNQYDITIIDSMDRKEAIAFIKFLRSEERRHYNDISDIRKKVNEVFKRFNLTEADLNMGEGVAKTQTAHRRC